MTMQMQIAGKLRGMVAPVQQRFTYELLLPDLQGQGDVISFYSRACRMGSQTGSATQLHGGLSLRRTLVALRGEMTDQHGVWSFVPRRGSLNAHGPPGRRVAAPPPGVMGSAAALVAGLRGRACRCRPVVAIRLSNLSPKRPMSKSWRL
jgi:hypothetical protein